MRLSDTDLKASLQRNFGMSSFKPGQERVISALLASRSAAAIFPTGGGKSLCYQLPALLFDEGLTVCVSPLIALMKDQVDALRQRGHAADMLGSMLDLDEKIATMQRVRDGVTRILYVAPEQLNNEGSRALIQSQRISLLAIDEAHCISEWGHAFRPDYLRLATFAQAIGAERVLALTATATPEVAKDIQRTFGIADEDCVRTTFHRPNLKLGCQVVSSDSRDAILVQRLRQAERGPTIVYATAQKTTEEIAKMLTEEGLPAKAYHAGMNTESRTAVQDEFMSSADAIIVATIAFGMGIDKRDIRHVIHYNLPKSLEGYAQEIGRAGRDGESSCCDSLVCPDDLPLLEAFARCDTLNSRAVLQLLAEVFTFNGDPYAIGSVREISHSAMAKAHDMSETTLRMLLAFVDIYHGHLETLTPKYAVYQVQPRGGGDVSAVRGLISSAPGTRPQVTAALLAHCACKQKWAHLDVAAAARSAGGVERSELVAVLNRLESSGQITIKASQVLYCYKIRSQPTSLQELAAAEYSRMEQREQRELARIGQVLALFTADACQTRLLCAHFGEHLEDPSGTAPTMAASEAGSSASQAFSCGTGCQRCRSGICLQVPHVRGAKVAPNLWRQLQAANLPRDDPRLLARFAFGYKSPRITSLGLASNPLYGMFVGCAFEEVLGMCAQLCV